MNKEIESFTSLVKKTILRMRPYDAPNEGRGKKNILRLDFNEMLPNPHKRIIREVVNFARKGKYQIYPEYGDLDEIIANYTGVRSSEVMPTNGSDEAIDIVYRAIVSEGDRVILPIPTFATLKSSAQIEGAVGVGLYENESDPIRYEKENLEFPFDEIMKAIEPGIKAVVLCNPNNPTGTAIPKEQVEQIIKRAKEVNAIVMVDEAYYEFAREVMPDISVVDLISKYDNLYVARSLSKSMGIAAFRPGYVISQEKNIKELRKIRPPYSVNMAAVVAMKTLRYPEVVGDIKKYAHEVMKVSKPIVEEFYRKHGIRFSRSVANFHLIEDKDSDLSNFLALKGILTRPRSDPKNTLRVTIGRKKDTIRYLKAVQEYLNLSK